MLNGDTVPYVNRYTTDGVPYVIHTRLCTLHSHLVTPVQLCFAASVLTFVSLLFYPFVSFTHFFTKFQSSHCALLQMFSAMRTDLTFFSQLWCIRACYHSVMWQPSNLNWSLSVFFVLSSERFCGDVV